MISHFLLHGCLCKVILNEVFPLTVFLWGPKGFRVTGYLGHKKLIEYTNKKIQLIRRYTQLTASSNNKQLKRGCQLLLTLWK